MSLTDRSLATPAEDDSADIDRSAADRWKHLRWGAVALWLTVLIVFISMNGVPIDRFALIFWTSTGLLAACIGKRKPWTVLIDWLPFWLLLIVYDLTRGLADALGSPTWWTPQITAEKALFGGVEPTVWLQSHIKHATAPWWEVVVSTTYVSYFFAPYLIAGLLWVRSRGLFHKFALRFMVINMIALGLFIAVPAAPPWAASHCTAAEVADHPSDPPCMDQYNQLRSNGLFGKLDQQNPGASVFVERIGTRGFEKHGLRIAATVVTEGQAGANEVAAFPSLHAGLSLFLAVFLWPLLGRWWRPLLIAYPLIMAFSLVYSAEHYVVDILGGWLITAAVCGGLALWGRRRERARPGAEARVGEPVAS